MRALRLIYAWCFAVVAAACISWSVLGLLLMLHVLGPSFAPPIPMDAVALILPLVMAAPFAFAAFAVFRKRVYASKPATVACLVLIFLYVVTFGHRPLNLFNPWLAAAVVGVGGIVTFTRRKASGGPAVKPRPARIPGDGTNPIVNRLVLLGGIAGGIGGVRLCALWAVAHGLPRHFPPFFVLQILAAILVVLAIHEAGHAIAGLALRMKVIGFVVGPFQWYKPFGRWKFTFHAARLMAFVGQTMVAPTTIENFRNRKVIQVAAGPAASLLAGALAVAAILTARGTPWAGEWGILAVFADISTLVGLLNLIPFGSKAMYSDGAKLYQLLRGGLWADYHRAMGMVSAIVASPLRPRDYDIATLEQAAGTIAQGNEEVFVDLCAHAYYLDSGRPEEAARAIEKAEECCTQSALNPGPEWASTFVYAYGLLRRDAKAARRWWERMESSKNFHFADNMWDAQCALLLSEERFDEAEDAWTKADAWARGLPRNGLGESERHSVGLLREALDKATATQTATATP
jgi:hypothetical protein